MNERGHLSAETIDLLMLASLPPPDVDRAKEHLSGCSSCQARWSELEEDKARFEQYVFPRTVSRIEERAHARSLLERLGERWRVLLPALGLAAAALVAVVATPWAAEEEPYLGVKGGGAAMEVVAHSGGGQFAVKSGARLRPKDRIRFVVEPAGAKYLLIASKDGQGNVTVYHPYDGRQSAAVGPGRQELPGAIELDEVLGPERLLAIFSDAPLSADEVKQALSKSAGVPVIPGAKSQLTLDFVKER